MNRKIVNGLWDNFTNICATEILKGGKKNTPKQFAEILAPNFQKLMKSTEL